MLLLPWPIMPSPLLSMPQLISDSFPHPLLKIGFFFFHIPGCGVFWVGFFFLGGRGRWGGFLFFCFIFSTSLRSRTMSEKQGLQHRCCRDQRISGLFLKPLLFGRWSCITLSWEYKARNEKGKNSLCEKPFIQKREEWAIVNTFNTPVV